MANVKGQQAEKGMEKKIGGTTYVVTSHFQKQGSTAVEKIKCLLDMNVKPRGSCHK